ncbi:MAG TPA: glycosyltransferase family 4 protein [Steroidobacteraceae bacterium]
MISVLHVIDTGGPGGAETVFLQCATRLDPTKFASTAVVGSDNWLADRVRKSGFDPVIAPARGSFNLRYLRQISGVARSVSADLICAHLYGTAVYASALGVIRSIPVVSVFHGGADISTGDRFTSIKASIVRNGSRKVVFVSESLRMELAGTLKIPSSRSAIIPNGIDTTAFQRGTDDSIRNELRLPPDAILVGAIGNIRPAKAYDNLLHAARALADRSDRFYFVVAGECRGTLADDLIRLRSQLRLESHFFFLGLRPDIPAVLHNLDVFVLSSKSEGFSIACTEAMACEVPVVATRCGGPQEILSEDSGLLVAPGDPGELAHAIYRVAHEPELARNLSRAALKRVRDEYSLKAMLAKYEALYQDVLG